MRLVIFYLIIFISFSTSVAKGQISVNETPGVLEKLYGRLAGNFNDNDRLRINDSIRLIIDSYVGSDTMFIHRFKNLRYLGQITSPDSLLKIITWNLVLGGLPGRYFTYFIRKQSPEKKNMIYRLSTDYNENHINTDTIYHESDWYGALYYDIKPFKIDNNQFWVLLGIDYGNSFISRKIIEVLSFTQADSIIFGKKDKIQGGF
jgi:hypothetical protein